MKRTAMSLLAALALAGTNAMAEDDVAAKEWAGYMETLAPLGERLARITPNSDDPQMRQEMYRQLYSMMAQGYFARVYAVPEHPDFIPYYNLVFNWLWPNPDDVYYLTPIEGDGVYKISGYRGSVRMVTFTIGQGTLQMHGTGKFGPTLADYDLDKLKINKKDGSFEVILSQERPKGYSGNWWKLDPKATYIQVRQIAYDWIKEVDGRFAIDRQDRPAIRPRQSAAEIETKLKEIGPAAEGWTSTWLDKVVEPVNKVTLIDYSNIGGLTTQKYWEGKFDVAPDEALILETEVPKHCRYWETQLGNLLWNAIDSMNRQTSINGFTAKLDKDGKFRAVISARDPGVPNWLDTADYQQGYVFGRWTECSSTPTPVLTKVKLADIRRYLPADTPIVTAEARDASLRLRRKGAQLRRRW